MADNKKYYYLKLKDNFFDSEEIKILESQANGIYYSNLLIKLYLKSLKYNGALRFNDYIPYDEAMISTITNLNIDVVRSGLKTLYAMKLIERLDDGTIYMMNIQSFIGKSSSEADRKRLYREKIEEEKLMLEQIKEITDGQMSYICPIDIETEDGTFWDKDSPEIEKDNRDRTKDKVRERDKDEIDNQEVVSQSINLLNHFEKLTGAIGGLNLESLKTAVELHGMTNVKAAINIAVERRKPTMIYINGILKNWSKEGYPKGGESNGSTSTGSGEVSNKFAGFKPQEPRTLSEEERRAVEEELI